MSTVINAKIPNRRWSRPYAVTLSDTIANANLQHNQMPFKYLQNVGTAGLVMISWSDGMLLDIYLTQGQVMEGGLWVNAMSTNSTVGANSLRGFLGIDTGAR